MVGINSAFTEGGEAPDGSWFSLDEFIQFMRDSSSFTVSGEGMQMLYDAMVEQINSGGNIDEDFLNDFFEAQGIDRGYGQGFLEQMLNEMFNAEYTTPKHYFGEYADNSVNDFVKDNINNTKDWSQFGTIAQILAVIDGKLDGMTYVDGSDNVWKSADGQYFQFLNDGTLKNISDQLQTASISLSDAVSMLVQNPSFVLGLNKGPMNAQSAYDYIMGQFSSPAGIAANQGLLEQINTSIAAINPNVTVDITNPAPIVNVDVDVNVDKSGNVTNNVIQNYTGVDNWMYKYSQRNGSSR